MIIAFVGRNASGRVKPLLMLLTVDKRIVGLVREELVKLGRLAERAFSRTRRPGAN
jgi:hypothetical protein